MKPHILLMQSEYSIAVESGVYAFERLLDEATASGDTAADDLIQKTIRGQTGKCTIHSHLYILDASTHIRIELLSNKVLSWSKLLQKMLMKLFGNILMLTQ